MMLRNIMWGHKMNIDRIAGITALTLGVVVLFGCASETSTSPTGDGGVNNKLTGDGTAVLGGTVYHTGYIAGEGGFNYSIFVNTRRDLEVDNPDPSSPVATRLKIDMTVNSVVVDAQLAELKAAYLEADPTDPMSSRRERRYKSRLTTPSFWQITPQKAGIVSIKAVRDGRIESVWEVAERRTLVVSEYTATQVSSGESRYINGGTSMPCTTCHQETYTAAVGAPPHLLGRVIEIDDASAAEWISTGRTKDRQAKSELYNTTHVWPFANDAEKLATVAYLRSKQTPDKNAYAKLLYLEELAETREELELTPKLSVIPELIYTSNPNPSF